MGHDFLPSFWDEGTPSGTSEVRQTDEEFVSLKSSLRSIIGEEHEFNTAAADHVRGTHKLGSARNYLDVVSNLTASGTSNTGRGYLASDTSQFFVTPESGFTGFVGSAHAPEVLSMHTNILVNDGGGLGGQYSQNARWVQQIGATNSSGVGETSVKFNVEYDGQPVCVLTPISGAGSRSPAISDISEGGFDFAVWDEGDARIAASCFWISIGTVSF